MERQLAQPRPKNEGEQESFGPLEDVALLWPRSRRYEEGRNDWSSGLCGLTRDYENLSLTLICFLFYTFRGRAIVPAVPVSGRGRLLGATYVIVVATGVGETTGV